MDSYLQEVPNHSAETRGHAIPHMVVAGVAGVEEVVGVVDCLAVEEMARLVCDWFV